MCCILIICLAKWLWNHLVLKASFYISVACVVTRIDKEREASQPWGIPLGHFLKIVVYLLLDSSEQNRQTDSRPQEINWFQLIIWLTWLAMAVSFQVSCIQALRWNWASKISCYSWVSWIPKLVQRYVYLWGWRWVGLSNSFKRIEMITKAVEETLLWEDLLLCND